MSHRRHGLPRKCRLTKAPVLGGERILALEQGMERHEVEQLRRIAAGTYPLMDDTGETMLPLAPPEEPEFSARLRSRIRTHRKRTLVGEAGGFNALEAVDISMASEGPCGLTLARIQVPSSGRGRLCVGAGVPAGVPAGVWEWRL